METIAFIGIGIMGSHMARRLMDAGYHLRIFEKYKEKAKELISHGAIFCETIADVSKGATVIITMLGYPQDVETVYFGDQGLLEVADRGSLLIDMTTSSPSLAVRIHKVAFERGLYALDAPVSGGDVGARDGKLSIMVGGDPTTFQKANPIFALLGGTITLCGEAGMGQNTKMANQIAVGCNITAVAEALAYARAKGLDPKTMFTCVSNGAGSSWQMVNMSEKMINGDDRAGFFIRHLIKDLNIAIGEAEAVGVELPLLNQVFAIFSKLASEGMENCGTQAVYHFYDQG